MSENFYLDVLPPGQPVTATLLKGKINHTGHAQVADLPRYFKEHPDTNCYFALGAFPDMVPGPLYKPIENELLGEPTGGRAWAFDLDVGKGTHKYNTVQDAADALTARIESGTVPDPSWIVFSGGGLQFYYVLPEGELLPRNEWQLLQLQLKAYMQQAFRADPDDPDSPSQIDPKPGSKLHTLLRAPDTWNHNYGEPIQTKVIHEGGWYPQADLELLVADVTMPDTPTPQQTTHTRGESRVSATDRVTSDTLFEACAFMRHQHESGGAETVEPDWVVTANLLAHTLGTAPVMHECSNKHPEYDYETTQQKYEHVYNNVSAGPHGCHQITNQSQCVDCWVRQNEKITNPISAARYWEKHGAQVFTIAAVEETVEREDVEDEVTVDTDGLPEETKYILDVHSPYTLSQNHLSGFGIGDNGNLTYRSEDVGDVLCCSGAFRNHFTNEITIRVGKEGKVGYPIKGELLGSPLRLSSRLTSLGFRCTNREQMSAWLQGALNSAEYQQECDGLGWRDDFQGFYSPGQLLLGDEVHPSEAVSQFSRKWYGRAGTTHGWVENLSLLNSPLQTHVLIALLAGLGAPLMSYLGLERGAILALHGDPGVGKTTAMRLINSIWGRPLESLARFNDTKNALPKIISVTRNLPVTVDEYTHIKPELLQEWAMNFTQGEFRNRLTEKTSFQDIDHWHTIFITTGNNSYRDVINTMDNMSGADLSRVYEVKMERVNEDLIEAELMKNNLIHQHGTFGQAFIETIATQDRMAWVERAHALKAHLKSHHGMQGDDRYSEDIIVTAYFAHQLAKEAHPEFPGDVEETHQRMIELARAGQETRQFLVKSNMQSVHDFLLYFEANDGILERNDAVGSFSYVTSHSHHGHIYHMDPFYVVQYSVFQLWCRNHRLDPLKVIAHWARENHLVRLDGTPEHPQYKATAGRLQEPLVVNGKSLKNAHVLALLGDFGEAEEGDGRKKRKRVVSIKDVKTERLARKLKNGEKL